jgi:hypothetical protein
MMPFWWQQWTGGLITMNILPVVLLHVTILSSWRSSSLLLVSSDLHTCVQWFQLC